MIESKQDYKLYLEADRIAHNCPTPRGMAQRLELHFGAELLRFQKLLRKTEYYYNCKTSQIDRVYFSYLYFKLHREQIKYSFEIGLNCFGPGLQIAHKGPIIVSNKARIGANCLIHPDVSIGLAARGLREAPIIGNNVFIGPGAKIFGRIKIADGIAIGANSVVNKSFSEPNISIAGMPAKKISSKGTKDIIRNAYELAKQNLQ